MKIIDEQWADIKGFEGLYEVSNYGDVRSIDRFDSKNRCRHGKQLKLRTDKDGYFYVRLHKNGISYYRLVHRLVAEAFIQKLENKNLVNHRNEDKQCNRAYNLQWVNEKENCNYGSRNVRLSFSKLNDAVLSKPILRCDIESGTKKEYPSIQEAVREGFSQSCISRCCNGLRKSHKGFRWTFLEEAYYATH